MMWINMFQDRLFLKPEPNLGRFVKLCEIFGFVDERLSYAGAA
jgi:hypothetical protein